jgi:hypothetical protein
MPGRVYLLILGPLRSDGVPANLRKLRSVVIAKQWQTEPLPRTGSRVPPHSIVFERLGKWPLRQGARDEFGLSLKRFAVGHRASLWPLP